MAVGYRDMKRPALLAALCAILILVLADTAIWWVVTGRMAGAALAWERARQAEGYTVMARPPARQGWPLRAGLLIPAVTLATDTPGQPDAAVWQAGDVRLVLSPADPGVMSVLLEGPETVQLGAAPPVPISAALLDVAIPLDGSGARLAAHSLMLGGASVRTLTVQVAGLAVDVTAEGIVLGSTPLGLVDQAHLTASTSAPLPPLRDPASAARAWRDAGGVLTISQVAATAGTLDVSGSATMQLDQALQPSGSGTMRIAGFKEASDTLAKAGVLTRSQAQVAVTLLTLLARPGPGGALVAELPLRLDGGVFSAANMPLARLPALAVP